MNKFSIYIDNYASGNDEFFALKLKDRLQNIKSEISIITFSDLKANEIEWEELTIKAINNADIVIPIISPNYLDWVPSTVEASLDIIIESKEKYLFPIYLEQSEFGSFNWIIKSKLFPSELNLLSEYSANDSDKLINNLIKMIKDIITEQYIQTEKKHNLKEKEKKKGEKMIFISHDHDDSDFAEVLKLRLEKKGWIGWIDSERLKIGQDWRVEIDQSIEDSVAVVAIMTPEARKSEYVTYEWSFAWGKGKRIFPILLKQTPLHPRLESLQYLDFTNKVIRPWDELITSIEKLIK